MRHRLVAKTCAALLFVGALPTFGLARAATPAQPVIPAQAEQDYRYAQYVQVTLGEINEEAGIRLVEEQPDGLTEPVPQDSGRRSAANPAGSERYFYFDVHDSYIRGGLNKVVMTVTYHDRGLTPLYLEYDAFDPDRPDSTVDAVVKKRIPVAVRANTGDVKTERISLPDARFANHQPGGADFRFNSADELIITNVSVLLVSHEDPKPPIRVVVDGRPVVFDVVPYIDPRTSRTLVPMRAILTALGVTAENIAWDAPSRTVLARRGNTSVSLTIDSDIAYVNYLPVKLDQPAVIRADRTLVPVRFVSEQFGLKVGWDQVNRVITLTSVSP